MHQVSVLDDYGSTGSGMESAQPISAACQKYLREMGIDFEVWLHAMETPRDK